MSGTSGFAALARFVVRRRRLCFAGWAVAAAALLPLAAGVERSLETGVRIPGSGSARADSLLAARFASPYAKYAVLVVRGLPAPSTPEGRAALERVAAAVRADGAVAGTFSVLDAPDTLFVGARGGTFMVVGLREGAEPVDRALARLRARTAAVAAALRPRHAGAELLWTGEGALTADLREASAADAGRAERRVLPLTLLLLAVVFGALAAAAIPVAAGALAISLTLGAAALLARAMPLSVLVLNVATMLGLGLGVDYALLLVSRFREARGRGLPPDDAAVEAAEQAGHSIALSGAAVMVGFAALLAVPLTDLRSMALGGLLVTAVSVLVATTLLPGVLAALGPRVELGRLRRPRFPTVDGWQRWSAWVVRRPLLVLAVAGAPVALLAQQWRRLDARMPSGDWLPPRMESARGLRALGDMQRGGVVQAVRVIVELPPGVTALSAAGWRAVDSLGRTLTRDPRVARVRSLPAILGTHPSPLALALMPEAARATFVSEDGRLALLEVVPRDERSAAASMALVRELRGAGGASLTGLAGARLTVGGLPAFNVDYEEAVRRATPRVVALVVAGTLVALFLGFGSLLVPLKAVALNLLSVGAAFGAVVLVFQDGHGARWLGLAAPLDGVFPAVPLLAFCIVFGLSMDYEVFLVSRVAEARRRGMGEGEAVVEGVRRTGGVITSAALVMAVVFAAFVAGEFVLMKILGFALAVAVLVDVTVVRLALGPALLAVAGRWNWWPGGERLSAVGSRPSARSPGHAQGAPGPRADAIPSHDRGRERSAGRAALSPHPPPPAT